jgi:hypothetical protein
MFRLKISLSIGIKEIMVTCPMPKVYQIKKKTFHPFSGTPFSASGKRMKIVHCTDEKRSPPSLAHVAEHQLEAIAQSMHVGVWVLL